MLDGRHRKRKETLWEYQLGRYPPFVYTLGRPGATQ